MNKSRNRARGFWLGTRLIASLRAELAGWLAGKFAGAYVMTMRTFAVIASLVALLALAGWYSFSVWNALEGPPMTPVFWLALGGGVVFSLAIGCGLMALVYYSHRHGYDDFDRRP